MLRCKCSAFVCTVGLRIYNVQITYDDDDQGRRQLLWTGAKERANFFQGPPLLHLYPLILQHSRLATDSLPLYIMTYRKAKQQYRVFFY